MTKEELTRKMFEKDAYVKLSGIEIVEITDESATVRAKIRAEHLNANGAVQGGMLYTLADFAFAVAANWESMGCVSLHSDISFLGAAKGQRLIAKAVCVKDGKSTSCYRVDVTDDLGTFVATITVTGYHVKG